MSNTINATNTAIVNALIASKGEYVDDHGSNNSVSSAKQFAVLNLEDEQIVCPLPGRSAYRDYVSSLNPIYIGKKDTKAHLSRCSKHMFSSKLNTMDKAVAEFNIQWANSPQCRAEIIAVITV